MEELRIKIPLWVCNIYLMVLNFTINGYGRPKKSGLADGDTANVLLPASRNKAEYIYLTSWLLRLINKIIMWYIYVQKGIRFEGSINHKLTPVFIYGPGSSMIPHRDRDMFIPSRIPEYIGVLVLHNDADGGELYTNSNYTCDKYGKNVKCNPKNDMTHPLQKGELVVINNLKCVHGVTYVNSGARITTGFRSANYVHSFSNKAI